MAKQKPTGFADQLRRLREAAGLTQEQLADRSGMHKFGIAKLERGEREPAWATVLMLANALGVECTEFKSASVAQGDSLGARPRGRPAKALPATPPAADLIETRKKGKTDKGLAPASFEPETIPQPEGKKPRKRKGK